jgi:hypothetical protein
VLWRLPGRQDGGLVKSHARGIALMPGVSIDVDEISRQLSRCPVITREWFRQIRLRALETLCDQHRAAGHLDSAMAAGLAAVTCDPLRESAHRRLTLIHISEGNFAEALRQYHVYQQLARSELGLQPSPQFRKLISPLLGRPADLIP